MKLKTNRFAKACEARRTKNVPGVQWPVDCNPLRPADPLLATIDFSHPDMERRLRAKRVWEFLDEGKSTFYARMKAGDPSYDPLFPQPIPTSSSGKGPKRWKLGAVIAWLRACEAAAHTS
jgi:predicted DNA-binding transcriptional regulator AlpA